MGGMRQYFSLKGRASRLEWWVIEVAVVVGFKLSGLTFDLLLRDGDGDLFQGSSRWWLAMVLALLWINYASIVRRLHDRGKRGWWALLYLFPGLGQIWMIIECGFMEGQPQANRYGPPPVTPDPSQSAADAEAWLQGERPAKIVDGPARPAPQRPGLTPSRSSAVTHVEPRRSRVGAVVAVCVALVLGGLVTLAATVGIPIPVAFVTHGDKFPGEEEGGPGFEAPSPAPIDKALKPLK
jgi:uncharacterized membrane protein YhaH (DUF805 family)